MALLPQPQLGLLPQRKAQLLPLDMGASVRAEAEGHQQRFGAPQGAYIPFPSMPTKEQIGQWALQNPLDAAALATSPIPVVGDVIGGIADANALYNDPSWSNAGWMAAGLLPFVPAGTVKRVSEGLLSGDTVRMFHGTSAPSITSFDVTKTSGKGVKSPATFFTESRDIAKSYGPTVVEADVDLGNPIELDFGGGSRVYFDGKERTPSELANRVAEINEDLRQGYALDDGLRDELESLGWSELYADQIDSVAMMNVNDPGPGLDNGVSNNVAIFDGSKAIPTDTASRMARAEDMGFHEQPLYHGTAFDIDGGFKPSEKGNAGPGVYLTSDPDIASTYANYPGAYSAAPNQYREEGANVVPVRVRGEIAPFSEYSEVRKLVLSGNKDMKDQHIANNMIAEELKKRGYDGFEHRGGTVVMFNPENIRSVHAQFDPAKKNSADLLAGIGAGGLLGLGAYNRLSAEEEY